MSEIIATFTIGFHSEKHFYRMKVEHYYSSSQVERFKILGKGERFLLMEKRILESSNRAWKIISELKTENPAQAAADIYAIQDCLDKYLKSRGDGVANKIRPRKR